MKINKLGKLYKNHKGFILTSILTILSVPLLHLFQFREKMPMDDFLLAIPIVPLAIFCIAYPIHLLTSWNYAGDFE